MALAKLSRYRLNSTSAAWCGANSAAVMKMNTCSRAEHSENGMVTMVSRRSARERMTRVPISAGTLQPKPISSITKLRPSSPIFAISASIRKAARDR